MNATPDRLLPALLLALTAVTGFVDAVSVTVVGTRFSAQTDAEGRFTIAAVPPGTYRLRARMLGYSAVDTSAVVEDGQQSVVDLRLKRSPIELNPVVAIGYVLFNLLSGKKPETPEQPKDAAPAGAAK